MYAIRSYYVVEDMIGAGILNRADEAVPTREELLASPQRERGLPRPLLAVLLRITSYNVCYTKLLRYGNCKRYCAIVRGERSKNLLTSAIDKIC